MTRRLALSAGEEQIVRTTLAAHLPQGTRVAVFGSRATGTCKPWSDLDLAVESDAPLALSLLAELAEAFAESDLPWKVDLVDLATVSPEFRQIIAATAVPL